ncbi:EscU/YscU/HrcU family type III secretion system export apparatus switch protein [Paenibacillus sp. GCM10027626]|uniref:EscU/YscU/HrcU family type III secretion system export apparatus switch protein n=1 Tax=Paenibacillus sp. GCM10027626 TaxID=3273411 RepID=UPI003633BEC5
MSNKEKKADPLQPSKKAVALKYDAAEQGVPVVTAKGKGKLAEAILEKAAESGVPIQQDSSLVEVLSKLDVDQEIPLELYTLVAEVLSFVYQADRRAGELP